jgi:hypothetical protein
METPPRNPAYFLALYQEAQNDADAARQEGPHKLALASAFAGRLGAQYMGLEITHGKRGPRSAAKRAAIARRVERKLQTTPRRGKSAEREAFAMAQGVIVDVRRMARLAATDSINAMRHHGALPTARVAYPDGTVTAFPRDAGKQRTESCKGSPDTFSFAERDAIRQSGDAVMARCVVADWAGSAAASAAGSTERRLASSEELVDMARSVKSRTDAQRAASMLRMAPVINRAKTQAAMLAAMGGTLDRNATKRVRKAFIDAMR